MPITIRLVAAAVTVALGAAACGGFDEGAIGCGNTIREALDPQSGLHILDANSITYLTDPPTSGPHVAAPSPSGVANEPIPRPIQLALLEAGGVMVQYGDINDAQRTELVQLGSESVVVAPADNFEPNRVVATAWLHKLECKGVDRAAVDAFITERNGHATPHE